MLLSMSALIFLHLHEFGTGNRAAIFSGSKTQQPTGKEFKVHLRMFLNMAGLLKIKVSDGTSAMKSHSESLLDQILIRH